MENEIELSLKYLQQKPFILLEQKECCLQILKQSFRLLKILNTMPFEKDLSFELNVLLRLDIFITTSFFLSSSPLKEETKLDALFVLCSIRFMTAKNISLQHSTHFEKVFEIKFLKYYLENLLYK